ncbi:hypothetical protein [Streptomyces sp. NPDC003023]|uniref:hypothetical protein n=1 Tax=Streptomyces sp. NPDC003023 TaxID=3364675 RepID=UPI0036C1D7FF
MRQRHGELAPSRRRARRPEGTAAAAEEDAEEGAEEDAEEGAEEGAEEEADTVGSPG